VALEVEGGEGGRAILEVQGGGTEEKIKVEGEGEVEGGRRVEVEGAEKLEEIGAGIERGGIEAGIERGGIEAVGDEVKVKVKVKVKVEVEVKGEVGAEAEAIERVRCAASGRSCRRSCRRGGGGRCAGGDE
jgi:methyl coenzyme M reductase subunit D